MRRVLLALAALTLAGAAFALATQRTPPVRQRHAITRPVAPATPPPVTNVLIIVADDVGIDAVATYKAHPKAADTPHLDALAARGMLFRRAYAQPVCSPTRASLLTGRHPARHGVGRVVATDDHWAMAPSEITLPEMLRRAPVPWSSAALGKWHLASEGDGRLGLDHPNVQGFQHYAGLPGNVAVGEHGDGKLGYHRFLKVTNGVEQLTTRFLLTDEVDDALTQVTTLPEPWLVWLAPHAAHTPFQIPPPHLQPRPPVGHDAPDWKRHRALVHAIDTELGRLFEGMGAERLARTLVVFIGDNGTPDLATLAPFDPSHAKGTMMEEGVRVPLIIAGPGVVHGETDRLAHAVDLFPTVAELAGVALSDVKRASGNPVIIDGVSLWPVLRDPGAPPPRRFVMSEVFAPLGKPPFREHTRMIRDERYKLITKIDEPNRVYDLLKDPHERDKLTARQLQGEAAAPVAALRAELARLEAPSTEEADP